MEEVKQMNEGTISETERKAMEERIRMEMQIRMEYEAKAKEQEILDNIYTADLPDKIIASHVIPKMEETCPVLHEIENRIALIDRLAYDQKLKKEQSKQPGFSLNPFLSFLLYIVEACMVVIGLTIALTILYNILGKDVKDINGTAVWIISFILPIFLSYAVKTIMKTSRNKRLFEECENLKKRQKQTEEELLQYVEDNKEVYSFLPERYQTAFAADYIYKAFVEHRAKSMKEAFTLLEEEIKTKRIERAIGSVRAAVEQVLGALNG